jgi:hypothetical protein
MSRLLAVKRTLWLPLFAVMLAMAACRSDTIDLTYRYPEGSRTLYRMTAVAQAEWDIAGRQGSGAYEITFDIDETVESLEDGSAVVTVEMTTTDFEEQGLPSPGAQRRSFKLRLGPNGEKLEVLEVDGVPAADLDRDELSFIGTYRPCLALESVALHATWRCQQGFQLENLSQEIVTVGELNGLTRDADGDVAEIGYSSSGPLQLQTTLPQGSAQLDGTEETTSSAEFDITEGFLRSGNSTTTSEFEVSVEPAGGGAAETGSLSQDLRVEIELVERET